MAQDNLPEDAGMFPPLSSELESVLKELPVDADVYARLIESICGTEDDSQPVEQYDGTLGVSQGFVNRLQQPVGQLQWNDNLADIYSSPGNVSGVRWCTGTLVSDNLFLSAGHCFDQSADGWTLPKVNGTNDVIPSSEIATNMHVNFNYQVDPNGNPREEVEVAITQLLEYRLANLDFAILRLAGNPGRQFGVGAVSPEDAKKDDVAAIIGHPAGVRKRIEAGPILSVDENSGDQIRYASIDTLGGNSGSAIWKSPLGNIVGVHTNGGCTSSGGSNRGVRMGRLLDESPTLQGIISSSTPPLLTGRYTIQQKNTGRFVDAHEVASEDFHLVTRGAQNNDSQRWAITPVGGLYAIQQKNTGRFVDAHEVASEDFRLVTRPAQSNDSQRWIFRPIGRVYTLQQLNTSRFVDAHEVESEDFGVVTRTPQINDSQKWVAIYLGNNTFTLQQLSTGRFMDAHEVATEDHRLVTRTRQNNKSQQWIIRRA